MTVKTALFRSAACLALLSAVEANAQKPPVPPAVEPTRSLFRYIRDDSAPDKMTHVRIHARHKAAVPIDQNVFGNFIEHLGGVVDYTLAAQALFNPDLESESGDAKTPDGWELQNAVRQADGFHSPRCVRLSGNAADSGPSELRQRVARKLFPAPVKGLYSLTGTLYLRAPAGAGSVAVEIREGGRTRFTATLRADSTAWERRAFAIHLTPQNSWADERATLMIRHSGGGPVDCDRIELTPNDTVGAMALDMAKKAKEWDIPLLRWPGGNFASGYDWRDGIGPKDTRPTRRNEAWGGLEPNQIGTDEFLNFCEFLHCEPQLTVNAGNGTPENAAAWVAYCNAPLGAARESGKFAQMRAANGHKSPYHVRTWEIGNELYGGWQIGHTDPAGNAARFVQFRDAMRAVDPTLKIIATGRGHEYTGDGLNRNAEWNQTLLRAAIANRGTPPDCLSIHPLVPLPGGLNGQTYEAQYESAMAHPAFLGERLLPALARQIAEIEGPNPRTKIAPTEWGLIVGGETWRQSPNHDSLAGAIFNALTLNALLRNSDCVTLANMTAFAHGGGIKRGRSGIYVDPQYYIQQIYAKANPRFPLETVTTGPGRDVPQRGDLPAVPNVPDVDVFAALNAKNALTVFAVNRHLTESRTVTFTMDGFAASGCSAVQLTAVSPKEGNTDDPKRIAPKPFPLPALSPKNRAEFQIVIPPHTFVALTFTQ